MIGRARRPASLPIELVQSERVGERVDGIDLKTVLTCRHLRKLFFSRNRAGKSNDLLAWDHPKAKGEGQRRGIVGS